MGNNDSGPELPGISPRGGKNEPVETVNPLVRLAIQFFILPMAIVAVCVGLVFIFRWLTYEKRDLSVYLSALSSASRSSSQKQQDALKLLNYIQESKRWQGIYDVTEQLRFNREQFLRENPDFPVRVAQIFQQSAGADRMVRQYLAQVLGLVGGPEVISVLITALDDPDSETVIHSMVALGRIGNPSAIPPLLEISRSQDRGLRQTAIFVLGSFTDPKAVERCAEALNDPDLLVSWNAAFALGRHADPRAAPVLERFLDADYIERATSEYKPAEGGSGSGGQDTPATFHPERLEQYRVTAVRLLGQYLSRDPGLEKKLKETAEKDRQIKVRQAAIETLKTPVPKAAADSR